MCMVRQAYLTKMCYITVPEICTEGRCLNGGTCEDTQTGYECHCMFGFIGKTCGTGECYLVCL